MSSALEGTLLIPIVASLSSLPIEIKTIIVNLAKLQDENYKSRVKSYNKDESELIEGILKENEWRGKSLNALFLVNTEFSNLAAVHIFKHLSSSHVNAESFLFNVLPYRGSLFNSVWFDMRSKFSSETLSHLAALPNLNHLGFHHHVLEFLFGDLVKPGISGIKKQNFHYSALLAAGRRVKRLNVDAFELSHLNGILSAFSVLEKLTLTLFWNHEDEEDEGDEMLQLGVRLSQYSLKSLKLRFDAGIIPKSWSELDWKSFTSLKCLDCNLSNEIIVLDDSFFSFLNKFTSLEFLKLLLHIQDTSITNSISAKYSVLTQLTHLNIQCAVIQLSPLLLHFAASPIEVFKFETRQDNLTAGEKSSIETSLLKFVNQHQDTLNRIEVRNRFIEFDFSTLSRLCESLDIILIFSTWKDQYISDETAPSTDSDQFNYRRPILEKALNFGKNKLVELENDNDVEGLKEMFNNCKWLRAGLAEKQD